jgi:steroid 5-alpha reductase family enzyme
MGLFTPAAASNLKHVAAVVGGCNLAGFAATAAFETHVLTDLVGTGSFVAAAASLSQRNNLFASSTFASFPKMRLLLLNCMVIAWGTRLASYLFSRVLKLGEDKRFTDFFKKPGEKYFDPKRSFYPVKLAGFWVIQTMWGFLTLLPITLINSAPLTGMNTHSISNALTSALQLGGKTSTLKVLKYGFFGIPLFTGLLGLTMEALADKQKNDYRNNEANDGHWCDVGLWKYARYPNCTCMHIDVHFCKRDLRCRVGELPSVIVVT